VLLCYVLYMLSFGNVSGTIISISNYLMLDYKWALRYRRTLNTELPMCATWCYK